MALIEQDTWSKFADMTVDREPLFYHVAEQVAGDDGAGRLVVDLGCGAGSASRTFLAHGWRVFATDAEPRGIQLLLDRVGDNERSRLETAVGRFTEVDLSLADLVFASLSLPFAVEEFEDSLDAALSALKPGGWFVAVLFGPNDSWADEVVTVDRDYLEDRFEEFESVEVRDEEFDGQTEAGPKHWHWMTIIARRPLP